MSAPTPAVLGRDDDVATLDADGEVDLFSAATGRRERTLLPAGRPADGISISPDGRTLAVSHAGGSIDLLSVSGGQLHKLVGSRSPQLLPGVTSAAAPIQTVFSPNGTWLASAGGAGGLIDLFNVASGRLVRTFTTGAEPVLSLAINRQGNLLAAGDGASAYLLRFPSGSQRFALAHADPSIWTDATGGEVSVAFSADGSTLLTAGDQRTRVWNTQSGTLLLTIPFARGGAITPNAQRVVADSSGLVSTFSCAVCGGLRQLLALARSDLTRNFPAAERAVYLR